MKKFIIIFLILFLLSIGRIGQALEFDGTDDLVDMGDVLDFTTANMTISAWIYPRSLGETSEGRIVDKQQGATSGYRLHLDINNSLTFRVSGTKRTSNVNAITLNTWQQVLVTYDGSNVRFYVNSVPAGTVAETTVPSANANSLTIGSRANTINTFDGLIDDVRVYNRALTVTEIRTLQYGQAIRNGLVGYWQLIGASGVFAPDLSGKSNHGTLTNGPIRGRLSPFIRPRR